MTLLEMTDVVAGYGRGPNILQGASLKVEAGQIMCLIGPNGAGKSTLLKVICGLIHPRSGEIRYQGERINHLRPDQILARGICFVPQERSLFPEMTVRENLRMGGYALKNRREMGKRMAEVFDLFPDLAEKRGHYAKTLSGGQQQMLAMGRTLVLRPSIVLLDEPSLGLAPKVVEQTFEIVRLFQQNGMTVLLVEQNARKGLQSADWGCVLDMGKLLFEGPADSILHDSRIQKLYLGAQKEKTL